MTPFVSRGLFALLLAALVVAPVRAGDWPMWRYDASRSGVSPHALPKTLHLQWTREYPAEIPAWPDQEKMPFDICYEPIVVGETVFVNSSRHDCIRAHDVVSGDRKWIFFADGPVRFAPLYHNGKLYFTCDDGCLYCLNAESGQQLWKVRGGPNERRILGNERIISMWPARGAPVIADGTLYFAASIWPFMGVFIHAVEPETGKILWTNDGDGSTYMKQPHSTDAFASIAPQGPLAIDKDHLVLPGGRSIPAVIDRKSGKLLKLPLAENGKLGGGSEVITFGDVYFNGGSVFELTTSKFQGAFAKRVLTTSDVIFGYDIGALKAYDAKSFKVVGVKPPEKTPEKAPEPKPADPKDVKETPKETPKEAPKEVAKDAPKDAPKDSKDAPKDAKDSKDVKDAKDTKPATTPATKSNRWQIDEIASIPAPPLEVMIMAGNRIYGGGDHFIIAIDYNTETKSFEVAWQTRVEGKVVRLVAAADRLFAATQQGQLYCFGAEDVSPRHYPLRTPFPPPQSPTFAKKAQTILDLGGAREGYAVSYGYGDGGLVNELLRYSKLQIVALEPDADKTLAGRRRHMVSDLYGSRVAILPGEPLAAKLPPYFCRVIFATELNSAGIMCDEGFLNQAFHSLRPFGGKLILTAAEIPTSLNLDTWAANVPQARIKRSGEYIAIVREGPLPNTANWTNEHADSSNTRVGKDSAVKAPLGLLWFGGPSNEGVLPRHGHGPQPQVIDGRILIEGVDMIRCLDIYTGRMLWETKLPGVGEFYNNVAHQAGANSSGGNFCCTSDGIYVAWNFQCVVLDPDTGKFKNIIKLPPPPSGKGGGPVRWGYINVDGDHLIAGADPLYDSKALPPKNQGSGDDDDKSVISKSLSKVISALKPFSDNMSASRRLVVMDRHSGTVMWQTTANYAFRHNGICVGGGRLYAIDRLSGDELQKRKISTDDLPKPFRVVAFDMFTGDQMWDIDDDVFGTWLSYSEKHDILVEAGRLARDTLKDEPRGVLALDAKTGKELWFEKSYGGPAMLHGDEILLESGACDIRTGGLKLRQDPITGDPVPWKWIRTYGCNTPAASQNLLTFRSGAAGYFDLCNDGGTGNFGGFRSSCTNNLVVAGGLLTVPEYTRTCTCNYQNQTSVALIHMPEAEMWTYWGTKEYKGAVKRLGINLGAVGDRRADNGTLWLEYPSTGGVSPSVNVNIKATAPTETYRRFSGNFSGPMPWVASSGVKGIQELAINVGKIEGVKSRPFTVKLIFAEPDLVSVGQRRFHVDVQGDRKLADFDILKEAAAPRRSIVREFKAVPVSETLTIRFTPTDSASLPPLLCGIEMIEE